MKRTINSIEWYVKDYNRAMGTDYTADEICEAISHYFIKGLNWSGTPFEKEWM